MPLWQAGPLIRRLANSAGPLPQLEDFSYEPPELRLRTGVFPEGPAEVYRLCALLAHLLAGTSLKGDLLAAAGQRRQRLRALAEQVSPWPEAGTALFRTLDRGLRLEPTRRFLNREELRKALDEAASMLDQAAAERLCLLGTAGFFADRRLPLPSFALAGRQPEDCQLLFPPETAGVSRRHCRIALRWGTVVVTDLASRYGTFLDEVRLAPHAPTPWRPGAQLTLGSRRQALRLTPRL